VSTPTELDLPEGVRRTTAESDRGTFAVLEAVPAAGPIELGTAMLVPGYTGSKEDFIPVLGQLAAAGRRVLAIDMRGQHETPGPDDPAAYHPEQLGADIAALAEATEAAHLLGHSFGGLVAREAILQQDEPGVTSLTLLSSGPGALPGDRASELRFVLTALGDADGENLARKIGEIWRGYLEPQAIVDSVPAPVIAFLKKRMLSSNPTGLVTMARHLLAAEDRTTDLAKRGIPTFVLYGENDNAWPTAVQQEMAETLNARRACIPGAAHSPAVEAPATTAHALTSFWNSAEGVGAPAVVTS
jgi:pimeloyl-ACP methyl ester carboxylesterase